GRHLIAGQVLRCGGRRGDMHGYFLDQARELLPIADRGRHGAELHLNADLAADGVDVLADVAAAGEPHETGHGDVLAELADGCGDALLDRPIRILQPALVGGIAGLLDFGQHVLNELLEIRGAGDEVRLAVDFDQDAGGAVARQATADEPFAGRAARLLRRARGPAIAQDRIGLLYIAVLLGHQSLAL